MADENNENVEATVAEAPEAEAPAAEAAPAADEAPAEDSPAGEGEEVEVPAEFKELVEKIEGMTVLELHSLVKVLEKKFGVSAAAVGAAAPAAGAGGEEAAEQDSFAVELSDAGAQKIAVIKVVKDVLGLGLKEAKDMVDGAPAVLKEGVKKEEAEEMKAKIEEAGGSVTLK